MLTYCMTTSDPYDTVPRVLDIARKEGAHLLRVCVEPIDASFHLVVAFRDMPDDRRRLLGLRFMALHSVEETSFGLGAGQHLLPWKPGSGNSVAAVKA